MYDNIRELLKKQMTNEKVENLLDLGAQYGLMTAVSDFMVENGIARDSLVGATVEAQRKDVRKMIMEEMAKMALAEGISPR